MKEQQNTLKSKRASWTEKVLNPLWIGLATGLYPLVFYYSRNFGMANSWEQFGFFLALFLLFPVGLFLFLNWITYRPFLRDWRKSILPFFNLFIFFFFLKIILYTNVERKLIAGIFLVSILAAFFLHRHFKKWLVVQLLLALIGFIGLVPVLLKYINYNAHWTHQPDNIEAVVFQKRPNIYYIQPDGYVNFAELKKDIYKADNSDFENFLEENHFANYPHFRSNYVSTLTSNSATFMMKHHYYNQSTEYSEMVNARKFIISENSVLTIFKNNGYRTHFITEHPYLMVNRPTIGFDHTNFSYGEIPYLSTGFNVKKEVLPDLKNAMEAGTGNPNFFFVEIFEPSHIPSAKAASAGKEVERKKWLEKREVANGKIKSIVNLILEKDPTALILVMADHGGFVGLDYTRQFETENSERDIVYSAFGSMLSIHWPNGAQPQEAKYLKTSVNVFRIVFSYLSGNQKYLQHLQEDSSYFVLKSGVEPGVYQFIDGQGKVILKKQ